MRGKTHDTATFFKTVVEIYESDFDTELSGRGHQSGHLNMEQITDTVVLKKWEKVEERGTKRKKVLKLPGLRERLRSS